MIWDAIPPIRRVPGWCHSWRTGRGLFKGHSIGMALQVTWGNRSSKNANTITCWQSFSPGADTPVSISSLVTETILVLSNQRWVITNFASTLGEEKHISLIFRIGKVCLEWERRFPELYNDREKLPWFEPTEPSLPLTPPLSGLYNYSLICLRIVFLPCSKSGCVLSRTTNCFRELQGA